MAAKIPRYSGSVRILLSEAYYDQKDDRQYWHAEFLVKGKKIGQLDIGEPKIATRGQNKYDNLARNAIGFATYDGMLDEMDVEHGEQDYEVTRFPRYKESATRRIKNPRARRRRR